MGNAGRVHAGEPDVLSQSLKANKNVFGYIRGIEYIFHAFLYQL